MIQRKQRSDSAYDLEKTKLSDSQAEAEETNQSLRERGALWLVYPAFNPDNLVFARS